MVRRIVFHGITGLKWISYFEDEERPRRGRGCQNTDSNSRRHQKEREPRAVV